MDLTFAHFNQAELTLDAARDFLWDSKAQRYRWKDTRRFVSQQAVNSLVRGRIEAGKQDLTTLANMLVTQKLDLKAWQKASAVTLRDLYVQQFWIGRGGLKAAQSEDYLAVARMLRGEYRYLKGFAQDILDGKVTEAQFKARIKMYSDKSRVAYEYGRQLSHIGNGANQMRRRLGIAEHCPDCLRYEAMGWVAIGAVPLPTENCECRANCKCSVLYRDLSDRLPSVG